MLNQLMYGSIQESSGGSGDIPSDLPPLPPNLPDYSPDDTGGEDSDSVPNELMRCENSRLLYSDVCGVKLWTWWDFYQSGEENSVVSVDAYINDKIVCQGHATSHIIDYYIDREKIHGGKAYVTIYVHMSMGDSGIDDSDWNGSAACTHRIWGGTYGGESGFHEADKDHKCEKAGTCGGGATFKVVFDMNAGTYRIS